MKKNQNKYSVCMSNTKVVFVDDSRLYLDGLSLALNLEAKECMYFSDAQEALRYIEEEVGKGWLREQVEFAETVGKRDVLSAEVDIRNLHEIFLARKSAAEISCVVADYSMPNMNGVELLSQIKEPGVRRILLTGEADEAVAIEAFNGGLIDGYIKKSEDNALEILRDKIEAAHFKYWEIQCEFIMNTLGREEGRPNAFLDETFQDYFGKVIEELDIAEYCLLDRTGSCLMFGEGGEVFTLFVQHNDEMMGVRYEVMGMSEDVISEKIVDDVCSGMKMLCYISRDEEPYPEREEWPKHIFGCDVVWGEHIYWVVVRRGMPDVISGEVVTPSALMSNICSKRVLR